MPLIDPRTRAISLAPFEYQGQTLRITGTYKTEQDQWFHSVKNETTGEFKDKEHRWVEEVDRILKEKG